MSSPRLKPLSQQTIVITGATSGIGLATAKEAVRKGARVLLAARDADDLRHAQKLLRKRGGDVEIVSADVGREEDVDAIAQHALRRFGGFDTWVNNAGVGVYGDALDTPVEDEKRMFQTNYWGTVFGSRAAIRHLAHKPGGGALINVGSIASDMGAPLMAGYSASKHAIKGYTDTLRMELQHAGAPVSVTLIKPSAIDTPFDAHARNHMDDTASVPTPTYKPEMVAEAILHAAQHKSREITVGGSGKMLTTLAKAAPGIADLLIPSTMIPAQRQPHRDSPDEDSLYGPSGDNRIYADHGDPVSLDLFHTARMHPRVALGVLAGLGVAVAWASANRNGH